MELNEQQRKAATYEGNANNILVTAGAGCGKTRTIIARAIHLIKSNIDASRILMVTFTNRAAKEMNARLRKEIGPVSEQIQAGTFHSFCLKAMRKAPKSFDIEGLNIIDVDDQQSFMTLIRKRHIGKQEKELDKAFPTPAELVKYYSYSRNTCQEPRAYLVENTHINEQHIEICCQIFIEYQKAKESKGYLDYDDLLVHFSSALTRR